MNWSPDIFKSYDVRGVYPSQLNDGAAEAIGLAVASLSGDKKIVIGRDMRLSSPALHQALLKGLIAGGAVVSDIGLVPIDAVYFTTNKFSYDWGIMITASHNPVEYNGFKIIGRGGKWLRGAELKDLVLQNFKPAPTPGHVANLDIWPEYIEHLLSFVDIKKLKPLKVVVDAGNGMAGAVIPKLFAKLPFKLSPLYFELDGRAPHRPFNPLMPGAAAAASRQLRQTGADVGVMFDGDADRVFFLDEKGKFVSADVTLLLLAREFLNREPGAAIAYNLICSKAVPEFITKWGGRPLRSAVGYVNVAKQLAENNGVMGGELSAHYSFRDNFNTDSGFIALLVVLELLSRLNNPLSQLVKEYSPYFKLPEINLSVANKQEMINRVKKNYGDAAIDELDGITITYPDWWVNVRPSNTEPLLRVTIEANTEKLLQQKQTEVLNVIKDYGIPKHEIRNPK
ncbi:TPA: phosphomannomutase/phosphoglucomutase [Patescibacteria group bacterium]|nr:phosphomannomutase/phosphoglucomutase [Patescibacteria group bacterium]HCU48037.1 phosphomannomutase/phosphoglucomutase [Patescibacteria group bacterium]